MPFQCQAVSEAIQKPESGIVFTNTGITTPPFELKGQPLSNPPESLRNSIQLVRKANAVIDTRRNDYTADTNYYQVKVDTPNIIGANRDTTLRYDEKTYRQEFIAIHRNIWYSGVENPQISLVFTDGVGNIFHICIPISIEETTKNENQYLKYWINRNIQGVMPAGMTANELLNFREGEGNKVNFLTLEYCLNVNQTNPSVRYTLCLFQNNLKVHRGDLPSWFSSNLRMDSNPPSIPTEANAVKESIMKKRFDDILNYMYRGRFYSRQNTLDVKLISAVSYFTSGANQTTQNAVIPTYYSVTSRQIAGTQIRTPIVTEPGKRALQNIKCYPIDLVNQVDKDGNIVIDENTNKPIDVSRVKENEQASAEVDPAIAAELAQKQKENEQKIMFWIIFSIIFSVIICIIIALIVYFMKGKTYSPSMGAVAATAIGS